jgi:hypothetical protein
MEIEDEISRHLEWIEMVSSMLGSSELDDDKLRSLTRDDQCELGLWLASPEPERYGHAAMLDSLRRRHALFHELSGELITAALQGDEAHALSLQDQFLETSHQLIVDLNALRQQGPPADPVAP